MTVKEFFDMMEGSNEVNIYLYEVNENTHIETTSEIMTTDDGLHEEWKSAEVQSWSIIDESYMQLSVIK